MLYYQLRKVTAILRVHKLKQFSIQNCKVKNLKKLKYMKKKLCDDLCIIQMNVIYEFTTALNQPIQLYSTSKHN